MNRDEGIIYVLRKEKERALTNNTVTAAVRGDCLGKHKKTAHLCIRGV